jgi:TraM recognition site of TraD and TraG
MRPSVRFTLSQSNGLDFGQILRASKILLVSIPKGRIGEDTAILIGSSIVSRIWQEIQARKRGERNPFYLYIDEAPNFLNMPTALDTIFAEASKYGLGLGVANQQESQWPAQTRAAIHANTRNKVILKTSVDDLLIVSRTLGVTPEDVAGLGKYEAIVRTPNGSAATVKTRPLPEPTITPAAIRARSRRRYGRPRAEVTAELQRRYGGSMRRNRPSIGRQED